MSWPLSGSRPEWSSTSAATDTLEVGVLAVMCPMASQSPQSAINTTSSGTSELDVCTKNLYQGIPAVGK